MKKSSAFTFIELLVSIGIFAIFFGLSIPLYNNFTEQQLLENEGRKLVDIFEVAKNKTNTADFTPGSESSCDIFKGYQVVVAADNYTMNFCCGSASCTAVKTYSFSSSQHITATSSLGTYTVQLHAKGIQFPILIGGSAVERIIQLKNSRINGTKQCVQIRINRSGLIEGPTERTTCT